MVLDLIVPLILQAVGEANESFWNVWKDGAKKWIAPFFNLILHLFLGAQLISIWYM